MTRAEIFDDGGPSALNRSTIRLRVHATDKESMVLEITVERHDGYVLCRPAGELDAYTVAQFREALTELGEEKFVLVDLSDVPFMDSAGLGALIGGIRRARENDGDVAVACNRPALTRLLHTTGFDRIVPVMESVEEAVLALGEPEST
ncbi:MAG: STAS domain-containing protein [Acidimicrobiia bacterium]|nr:STAS domain-containing protein [Actinomycetota bacterium]MBL6924960.1 STAS domain-containing protein [Acidimicrobiia bacterium]MBL6926305.1 STAS domain-containing protein [Acidimicrobiia bacterium]